MRRAPLLPVLLLVALTASCDQLGGGEVVQEMPQTFAVVSHIPKGSSAGIPVTTRIVVNFSAAIDPSSIIPGVLTLNGQSFGEFTVEGLKLGFTPAGPLTPGSSYTVQLSPDIRGINGHLLGPGYGWSFKTGGSLPPPPDTTQLTRERPR